MSARVDGWVHRRPDRKSYVAKVVALHSFKSVLPSVGGWIGVIGVIGENGYVDR